MAAALVALLLAPLLVTVAGPASTAAAVGPAPIPGDLWDITPDVAPGQSYFALESDPDEHLFGGATFLHTQADAAISVAEQTRTVSITARGDVRLFVMLRVPAGSALAVGYYDTAPFVSYGSQACGDVTGWFAIDELERTEAGLTTVTARFEQRCGDSTGTARGKVRWTTSDTTQPPGPQAIPAGLWDIEPDVAPGRSYLAIDGSPGDGLTNGLDQLYTRQNATFDVVLDRARLSTVVLGDRRWTGQLQGMSSLSTLSAGYYPDLQSYASYNPAKGGLAWFGGSSCNLTGWFVVDQIEVVDGALGSITVRFSETCNGANPLFGKLHWESSDTSQPPGPTDPPPDLWDASPGVSPSASYFVTDSPPGDVLAKDRDEFYTAASSVMSVSEIGRRITLRVGGDVNWQIELTAMSSISALQTGYYPNIRSGSTVNAMKGGLHVVRGSTSCSGGPGWFAIDEISRSGDAVTSITVRFGSACETSPSQELRGKLRWNATDNPPAAGTPALVPSDLWNTEPPVASDRTYVVIDGEPGDGVSDGADHLFTRDTSRISLSETGNVLELAVDDLTTWRASFSTLGAAAPLEPGYYPDPAAHPTINARRSAMAVSRGGTSSVNGTRCAFTDGWFAIDSVARDSAGLRSATVRFDLSCDGVHHLKGKVRWLASDTSKPGPVLPVPSDLWDEEPPGVTGDYAYVEGADGDPLTGGADDLYLPTTPGVPFADSNGSLISFWRSGSNPQDVWVVELEGFDPEDNVGPGYYGNLSSETPPGIFTPGLQIDKVVSGSGLVPCASPRTGWFAVDRITRIDGQIAQLDVRFEQSCDGAPPLHGRVHYDLGGMPSGSPAGALETATPRIGGVDVSGWAIDPDTMGPVSVKLKVDGSTATTVVANGDRPDIGASHPPYGSAHGFTTTVPVPLGTHQVCAVGVDPATSVESTLGCRTVTVGSGSPFGAVDVARAVPGGVQVAGWVIDPDTAASTDVHVYVDGVGKALRADGSRSDVANAYPGYGSAHGFGVTVPASPGVHSVCVYGINVGVGANSTLVCRTVTVLGGSPVGSLDVARQGPQMVAVAGWALDFDTAASIPVHVYVDGRGTAVTANGSRPDVGSAYPGYGAAHGFSVSIPATPGSHQVCVYGINTGAGANSLIGCRTISVSTGSPIGTIDVIRGGPGWVSLGGWALDPDTGAPIPVHVYVDSKGTALSADGDRPDVGAFFQGWGNAHGYATTISTTPGVHTVCAYAINVGPGANSLLGCRTVAVSR